MSNNRKSNNRKSNKTNNNECCICSKEYFGYGNNPYPLTNDTKHRCCDACNARYVIPARFILYTTNKETK